ncbi:hypothetical protein EDC58_0298 [Caminibacter pacificus]|uniref:Uncharacterized protein n=1 Tax=Caminibacter pacificus TaxID=1424653 RepID=A0AAJ4RDL7_9BACT|nr:hypothetical protein EDC58_0298 [Caminibacter pacificus]
MEVMVVNCNLDFFKYIILGVIGAFLIFRLRKFL